MEKYSERIKELRLDNHLTQTELALATNLSQAGIAKWETGDRSPSAECLIILAKYFKVSTDYILGLED